MEQHPVPRNISSFQFHLIGDLTLRQFTYLAAGAGIGYLIFKTAPFPSIITISAAFISGFIGAAFAFLPIQERPLDKWLLAFIKSVFSPTQYLWQKDGLAPEILTRPVTVHIKVTPPQHALNHKEANEKLKAYLATLPVPLHESINTAEKRYIEKTLALFHTSQAVTIPTMPALQPSSPVSSFTPATPIIPTPVESPLPKTTAPPPPTIKETTASIQPSLQSTPQPSAIQNELAKLAAEKEALKKELLKLQQQLSQNMSPQIVKPASSPDVKKEPTIKTFSPKSALSELGMMNLSQAPNLISGVIKDPQRKVLPNIILTIKDKNGLPVRALKTNKLGQFSTATILPNGTYLLEIEDTLKRFVFDIAEIALSGKVFLPIEIIAKGEKELMREKLTKELFGSPLT